MFLLKKKENKLDNKERLTKIIKKLKTNELFFIRNQINIVLKERGVLKCSK